MLSYARSRVLFLALGIAPAAAVPVEAKAPFDGPWAVTIMTESGTCDPAYRYAVVVADGNVSSDARESTGLIAISGKVDGKGQVKVSLRRGEQEASASGRLSQNGGAGVWTGKSPSTVCS